MAQDSFVGFVDLGQNLAATVQTRDSSESPVDATALPTYRIYGPNGLMGTGTAQLQDSGANTAITAATNATPIQITSTAHGLNTGTRVTVAGVGGNTAANGTFTVTVVNANAFTLDGSVGNGVYTSGGTWHSSGLFSISLTPTANLGYQPGLTYTIVVNCTVSGVAKGYVLRFVVS